MANPFNYVPCLTDPNNTGFSRCIAKLGMLTYTIALPRGTQIALADAQPDTFEATLDALMNKDNPAERAYVIGKYWKITDSTGEPVKESGDGGVDDILYPSAYIWMRQQKEGGLCAHQAMLNFSDSQDKFDFLEVFKSNEKSSRYYIMGTIKKDPVTFATVLMGIRYDTVYTKPFGIPTGSTAAKFEMQTTMLDTRQINQDRGLVGVNFEVGDLTRVMDVNLQMTKASTGNFDVLATMGCGGENLTELYSTLDDATAFIVYNDLGNVVPIAGVTVVGKKYRLALTTADANYTAGTKFRAKLAPLSVITATPLDADPIESGYSNYAAK